MESLDIPDDTASPFNPCTPENLALVRPVLERVIDKWTVIVLTTLCFEPKRFNEIKRRASGITHKSLSETLKRLEENGLVTRTILPTRPIGVEYAITPMGLTLREPFEALCAWALAHRGLGDVGQIGVPARADASPISGRQSQTG